mgnify:CR=1 FL=1
MKLWEKGNQSTNRIIEQFTVGNDRELDLEIAQYDIQASKAHAKMLNKVELLSNQEYHAIAKELKKLQIAAENGTFTIEEKFEDVHSKIEYELTEALGDTGKKIHAGRSRNDQVLVCLHLYVKDQIFEIEKLTKGLFEKLQQLSEKHKKILMPGYTHMQVAMPSSVTQRSQLHSLIMFTGFRSAVRLVITLLGIPYISLHLNFRASLPIIALCAFASSCPHSAPLCSQLHLALHM